MRRCAALPSLLFLLAAGQVNAQTVDVRDIASRARAASVLIHAMDGESIVGQGSGFLVSADGKIVTNRHVIEDARTLRVQLSTGEIYDNVFVVSDDERRDLAILRIPAASLPALRIGDDQALEVGDPVYVMGNPMGLEGTFSNGLLSAKRTIGGVALLQITAPISSGSSGGAVLNARGEVIGIATLVMREGQNLNMAVPGRYAAGLLAMNETPTPFAEVASRFRDTAPARTNVRSAPAADEEDTPLWLEVLTEEMLEVSRAAKANGLSPTHEPKIDVARNRATAEARFRFTPADGPILMTAVCDVDCTDVDILVRDPNGTELGNDYRVSDRATVAFTPKISGLYVVRLYMAKCETETCGYAIMPFTVR